MEIDELKQTILNVYREVGFLTYKNIFEKTRINQKKIQKYFGNIKQLHEVLNIEYIKKKVKKTKCDNCSCEFEISKYQLNDFKRLCDDCKKRCLKCGNERELVKPTYDETDLYCHECNIESNRKKYENLEKDVDYVECPMCGYRSKSLEGHYRTKNKTWTKCTHTKDEVVERFGNIKMNCRSSDQQAKETRRENGWFSNRESSIAKFKNFGGNHIRGKTKETSDFVRRLSETKKKNYSLGVTVPHNKNKTMFEYDALKKASENIKKSILNKGSWAGWNALNLTMKDFEIYLDKNGYLNKLLMVRDLKVCFYSVSKYQKILNIKTKIRWQLQYYVLEMIKSITGKDYHWEYVFQDIIYYDTHRHPRYDGYFESLNLVVEVNGCQHYKHIKYFAKTEQIWKRYLEKCEYKKAKLLEKGIHLIEVSYLDDLTYDGLKKKVEKSNKHFIIC